MTRRWSTFHDLISTSLNPQRIYHPSHTWVLSWYTSLLMFHKLSIPDTIYPTSHPFTSIFDFYEVKFFSEPEVRFPNPQTPNGTPTTLQ